MVTASPEVGSGSSTVYELFKQLPNIAVRNRLAGMYDHLAVKAARLLVRRLCMPYDDLVQIGRMALLEAITRFDLDLNVEFERFAYGTIRGRMLDEIRRSRWHSRRRTRHIALYDRTKTYIKTTENRHFITTEDVIAVCKVDQKTAEAVVNCWNKVEMNQLQMVGTDMGKWKDMDPDDHDILPYVAQCRFQSPEEHMSMEDDLFALLRPLTPRERTIVRLTMVEQMNLREAGRLMGISESRACGLRSRAISELESVHRERARRARIVA